MFGIGVGIRVGGRTPVGGSAYDADAQAFFDRVTTAGGTLTTTEKNATNQLVLDMKSAGIWSSMKAVYPMVGASAAACAQNLKSSSFTGTFSSGWTFASTGVTGNGTSAFFNTTCAPSQMSQDSIHMSYYSRDNLAQFGMMGASNTGVVNLIYLQPRYLNDSYYVYANNATGANSLSGASTTSQGFYLIERTTSTNNRYFRNGSLVNSAVITSATPSNNSIYVGAANFPTSVEYSSRECALASIGDGLTDTQASNFYTAVQAFQTTLSRNV